MSDKVRLDNTGSYVGAYLMNYTSSEDYINNKLYGSSIEESDYVTLTQDSSAIKEVNKFSQDSHRVQIGFSPTDSVDEYILEFYPSGAFDYDNLIGDPSYQYSDSQTYPTLDSMLKEVSTNLQPLQLGSFIQTVENYDSSLFRVLQSIIPSKTNANTGVVIKPNLLSRTKTPKRKAQAGNKSQEVTILAGNIEATHGGVYESRSISYDSTFTQYNKTPFGLQSEVISDSSPFITGELGSSTLQVSNGELNQNNKLKKPSTLRVTYNVQLDKDSLDCYAYEIKVVETVYNPLIVPSPSVTPSNSITPTPTVTTSKSTTPSVTPSVTPTLSTQPVTTPSPTPSRTPVKSPTPTISVTPSVSPSLSMGITVTPTPSLTVTPSISSSPGPRIGFNNLSVHNIEISDTQPSPETLQTTGVAVVSNGNITLKLLAYLPYNLDNVGETTLTIGGKTISTQVTKISTSVTSDKITLTPGTYPYTFTSTLRIASTNNQGDFEAHIIEY